MLFVAQLVVWCCFKPREMKLMLAAGRSFVVAMANRGVPLVACTEKILPQHKPGAGRARQKTKRPTTTATTVVVVVVMGVIIVVVVLLVVPVCCICAKLVLFVAQFFPVLPCI